MASYNLNEVLKKKKKGETNANGEVKLDDVSRVKVLSPSMQVFKRFIRNRLAVFGSVVIIVSLDLFYILTDRSRHSISMTPSMLSLVLQQRILLTPVM